MSDVRAAFKCQACLDLGVKLTPEGKYPEGKTEPCDAPGCEANLADCCRKNPTVGVAAIPGLPMSIGWCQECLNAGVQPSWAIAMQVEMMGGIEEAAEWFQDEALRTLAHFGISAECLALAAAIGRNDPGPEPYDGPEPDVRPGDPF